jgi:hypothetical protein
MTDRREQVLAQLVVLLGQIPGITLAARNLDEITELGAGQALAVLYDGDENAHDNPRARGTAGNVVYMLPEIIVTLGEVPETIGTTTNEWRAKLIKKILFDPTLPTICGMSPHSAVRYVGCLTSLHPGRAAQVMLTATFEIGYSLVPTEL